ncbi:MAG: UDP-N-acetylglucosamine 1-carboxyvinyltransferase [Clostridiales bacterium]|nr:UDP-N-acetylglucosamine 1-carboxyvinyltransferase [Clostridiales bacterium]
MSEISEDQIVIRKSPPLRGAVRVDGSKNSVLPIMAASLLSDGECAIRDVPELSDVEVMAELLSKLGADVRSEGGVTRIDANRLTETTAPHELAGRMRASFLLAGPLLARTGRARIPLPGGCRIGERPVELHLKGFAALGAEIEVVAGYVECSAKNLRGASVYLDFPSVGATENIMMAAALADGTTTIQNCAVEPEIVDLASFLVAAGADVRGSGTDTIRVKGVPSLSGCDHTVIPDRVEAGTYMTAAAITGGDVTVGNVVVDHLKPVVAKLREAGADVTESDGAVRVRADELKAIDIKTLPYPGFPTDMQAQFMALLSVVPGTSIVTETVFENRFMHAGELKRMGANIVVEGRVGVVEGVPALSGAEVRATDLRAGAGLILAGLIAGGETRVSDVYHIDRGYGGIDRKLRGLGANIDRIASR